MTPENQRKLDELYEFMNNLKAESRIPYDVAEAFRSRVGTDVPDDLVNAPVANVADVTGGSVIDVQARATVDAVKDSLVTLGLMQP